MSCSTAPTVPNPILTGSTQELLVRTDPTGAACSLVQGGNVVATVESTPGKATVPREFRRSGLLATFRPTLDIDEIKPLAIVCHKEGYLEYRRETQVARAFRVWQEEGVRPEKSPAQEAGEFAVGAAGAAAMMALPSQSASLALAAAAAPAAVIAPLAVGALIVVAASKDAPPRATFAYRALPEIFLVPERFETQAACDKFFSSLEVKLRAARDARRARIDAECRFFPCKASDLSPCPDLVCANLRTMTDEYLETERSRIPEWRSQVRIVLPQN